MIDRIGTASFGELLTRTNLVISMIKVQTLAEKEAWILAKALDLDLITILPTYVVGPLISSRTSTSVKFFVVRSGLQ